MNEEASSYPGSSGRRERQRRSVWVVWWCDSAQVSKQMDLWWSGLLNFETPPYHGHLNCSLNWEIPHLVSSARLSHLGSRAEVVIELCHTTGLSSVWGAWANLRDQQLPAGRHLICVIVTCNER